ncbi:MarR family winged helix-turn-helix transcriptional regulator [Treponema sp. C6A8]|uniref:MarR family winged helix-turn-helix transcriptional regulator n=1 Tax=Treponema sp. C6A8 TaxID=1410609 RepID=UPI00048364B9|nr:MarR family transcriptional regulator [Treponema sp. C6A8]
MSEQNYDCLLLKNQLCFPLYAASREILRKYTPLLKELDLTYTQYIVMMVLWEEKELKVTELGSRLFLDTGTLSPLLKSMEKKKLLCRTRSKNDERIVMVAITKEGEALREKASSVPKKIGSCVNLSQQEAETLYKILYKIIGN